MRGRISKGVAGSYVVLSENGPVICKPNGIFRNDKKKPLVGDSVEFDMLPDGTGVIAEILERTSILIRPEVANATQAMLVFAITQPDPAMNLADRFLINMEMANVPTFVVFIDGKPATIVGRLSFDNDGLISIDTNATGVDADGTLAQAVASGVQAFATAKHGSQHITYSQVIIVMGMEIEMCMRITLHHLLDEIIGLQRVQDTQCIRQHKSLDVSLGKCVHQCKYIVGGIFHAITPILERHIGFQPL